MRKILLALFLVVAAADASACSCGLIYAYEDDGKLETSTCSRTKLASDAAEELKVLRRGEH